MFSSWFDIGSITALLGVSLGGVTLAWWLGFMPIIGAVLKVAAAALAPLVELISEGFAYAVRSAAEGLRISITNIGAFWVIYPVIFVSGGLYFNAIDPIGARATRTELRHVISENDSYRKRLKEPPRKAASAKAGSSKPVRQPESTGYLNPFSR